jgi:hypothetical protein
MAAEQELEANGGLARTLKDLFAGAAGGVAQVLLGKWNQFARLLSSGPGSYARLRCLGPPWRQVLLVTLPLD